MWVCLEGGEGEVERGGVEGGSGEGDTEPYLIAHALNWLPCKYAETAYVL